MSRPVPILISPRDLESIHRHGETSYPQECCGFLIGRTGGEAIRVERVLPAANQGRRSDRFTIHPETVLAVHKEARAAGLDVVGFYHSHPDHPARPSRLDREDAWPGRSYLIVSVAEGRAVETRSWRLSAEAAVEQEVRIERAA
jgi:proteasome lid subunit RPN8/RPN11